MPDSTIRVVIDTNLWVSMALGSRAVSEQMARVLDNPSIALFISAELLDELTDTLAKPKLQRYLSKTRTQHLFDLIWLKGQLISPTTSARFCRDPKDDFIINLALTAQAQYIVTGDDDLLTLNPIGTIEVVTIADFVQKVA